MQRFVRHGIAVLSASLLMPVAVFAQAEDATPPPQEIMISQQTGVEVRGDFQVGPTRFVLEMDPGEERTIEVQLTSREGQPRSYDIQIEDFSVTDDGTDNIQFYANGNGPFSARSWVEPIVDSVDLKHGERAFIKVKITVPMNAAVGDHYSVVLFERKPAGEVQGGFNLISRVGALLLITVKGDLIREGDLQMFTGKKNIYWMLPAQFSIQYRNTGTVHLVPAGHVQIKNIFGIPVDDIAVKDWYVLRNSTRRRDILWQPKFALGRYTATLTLNSPGQKGEEVRTLSFWVLPALPVLLALLAIFTVSFLVQAFLGHFEIKKKGRRGKKD
ncbi:MAG: hypothetical protein KBC47_02225 [Candidatus Peribacteraceae bacterium]|nr:hypothetical protein [Candidatus Peribacteraceae bacterium]